ncbi:unnamed protein product [Taenia asiatica]|uniref:Resolvase/invertase-type recombinase catalytic domain-containing protein n=1 Tax=Taenia asiatica TaxID=60517 RepID=A0A0R3WCD6_TAEAS|nr:unnamed protein product [Taenia asiatica]
MKEADHSVARWCEDLHREKKIGMVTRYHCPTDLSQQKGVADLLDTSREARKVSNILVQTHCRRDELGQQSSQMDVVTVVQTLAGG